MSALNKVAKLEAQIAALEIKLAEARELAKNEVDLDSLVGGESITVEIGRGEDKLVVEAVLEGVKRVEGESPLFKVKVGTGFDAKTQIVFGKAIKSVVKADEQPAEQASEVVGE
jgi:hypothetical protein